MANQVEKQNSNGLNNLKSIYKIQSSGEIQLFLRDLRASKSQLDDVLKKIGEQKKNVDLNKQVKANNVQQVKDMQNSKAEPTKEDIKNDATKFVKEQENFKQNAVFNKGQYENKNN